MDTSDIIVICIAIALLIYVIYKLIFDRRDISRLAVIWLIILSFGSMWKINEYIKTKRETDIFGSHNIKEYIKLKDQPRFYSEFLNKKIVIIDENKERIDTLHFDLPVALRASTPQSVGTIALLNCSEKVVGMYSDGSNAYRWKCDVTLIDKDESLVLDRKTIYGDSPPLKTTSTVGGRSPQPGKEIIQYIMGYVK